MDADDERFDHALKRFSQAGIAGALMGLPIVVLAVVGASSALMVGYLIVAVIVLTIVVVGRRFRR